MVASKQQAKEKKCRSKRGRHCQWDESAMTAALEAVQTKQMSQRAACQAFNIPRCTLQVRLSAKTEIDAKPGRPSLMSSENEEKLVDYACNRASMGIGFGRKQFLSYAGTFAQKHNIRFKHGNPSLKWWRGIKRRHLRVRLRQPEGTATVRHQCMDKEKVSKYFHVLRAILDENDLNIKPNCIWNMDETGVQLDHKPGKVLAAKGTKYLHSRTSGNRETITIIAAVNAAGGAIAPHVIVKGKTKRSLNSFQTEYAPEGTTWSWSDSGWTKQGIALLWFTKSFLPSIGQERPQILILDGHDSHNFIELINTAIQNNIHIIELPAHTSNWLQPCDRTVFGPFKNAYRKACDELMISFPGSLVSRGTFCGILNKAWSEAVTSYNIQSGFRACGFHPFHPDAIPAEAYMPNSLYASAPSTSSATPVLSSEESGSENKPTADIGEEGCLAQVASADILNLSDYVADVPETVAVTLTATPPEIALDLIESSMSPAQLECYKFCLSRNYDLDNDDNFVAWKQLKLLCDNGITAAVDSEPATNGSEATMVDRNLSIDCDLDTLASTGLDVSVSELLNNSAENEIGKSPSSREPEHQLHHEEREIDTESAVSASLKEVDKEARSCVSTSGSDKSDQERIKSSDQQDTILEERTDLAVTENVLSSAFGNYFPFRNRSSPNDADADVLPYPPPVIRNKKSSSKQKFFLLTSTEARETKLKELQEKIGKAEKKKEREVARAKKREEKLKSHSGETSGEHRRTSEKTSKKVNRKHCALSDENRPEQHMTRKKRKNTTRRSCVSGKRTRKDGSMKTTLAEGKDMTPCATCFIRHCDSSDQSWIQCQQCDAWYHNACQGLDEQGPNTFECISCEDSAQF